MALNSGEIWVLNMRLLLNPKGLPMVEIDGSLNGECVDVYGPGMAKVRPI